MNAGGHQAPEHTPSRAASTSVFEVHLWDSGHGYIKCEVHWARGPWHSRSLQRRLVASFFEPGELDTQDKAMAIIQAILGRLQDE